MNVEVPDATVVLTRALTDVLPVPVRWTVPHPRPDRFVVVRRAGSGRESAWAEYAAMDVEVWAGEPDGNPRDVHLLTADVESVLRRIADRHDNLLRHVTITGKTYLPDPISRSPRMVIGATAALRLPAAHTTEPDSRVRQPQQRKDQRR